MPLWSSSSGLGEYIDTDLAGALDDGIVKIDKTLAMGGGNRYRLTKPEFPGFGEAGRTGSALAFVGEKHDMRSGAADLVGEELVGRGDPRGRRSPSG